MLIGCLGLNYKTANLELRDAFARACQKGFGNYCIDGSWPELISQCIVISTCNRSEIYFSSQDLVNTHGQILKILRHMLHDQSFEPHLYSYFGRDCFEHLCQVAAGLDSAILAETEIQGQVKIAYREAKKFNPLPSPLHFLFQKSFKISKEIRKSYSLARGMPSLESILLSCLHLSSPSIKKLRLLFVGASHINLQLINFFLKQNFSELTLCNRSLDKAKAFTQKLQIPLLHWQDLPQKWMDYDAVILATKAQQTLLPFNQLPTKLERPITLFDLSVPRNASPELGSHPLINLYNIDELNQLIHKKQSHQHLLIGQAKTFVSKQVQRQAQIYMSKTSRCPLPSNIY